jgi:hypothetical protein
MRRELVTGVDATGPLYTICVKANLISFRRIDPFKANLCRADGQCVAINNPRHA